MLGLDGKEKPVYKDGALVHVDMDGLGTTIVPGIIRGLSYQNVVDIWIVELVNGSPSPETYPYRVATFPTSMLSPRLYDSAEDFR